MRKGYYPTSGSFVRVFTSMNFQWCDHPLGLEVCITMSSPYLLVIRVQVPRVSLAVIVQVSLSGCLCTCHYDISVKSDKEQNNDPTDFRRRLIRRPRNGCNLLTIIFRNGVEIAYIFTGRMNQVCPILYRHEGISLECEMIRAGQDDRKSQNGEARSFIKFGKALSRYGGTEQGPWDSLCLCPIQCPIQ